MGRADIAVPRTRKPSMTAQHTGPWRINDPSATRGLVSVIDESDDIVVTVEVGADARLIAAAPDLLAACKRAWLDCMANGDHAAADLGAAIAKAEGTA